MARRRNSFDEVFSRLSDPKPLPPHMFDVIRCPICRTSTVFALFGLGLLAAFLTFAYLLDDPRSHIVPTSTVPYVNSEFGVINGRVVGGGAEAFLGIPYAEAPIGDLRFAAPKEWTAGYPTRDGGVHGEFDAFAFGDVCVQFLPSGVHWDAPQSENCLTLNVWRPPPRNATADANGARPSPPPSLPVLVFLHGGAFVSGGTAQAMFDGAELALAANAIVVTVNYRLGPLGFLALPALTLFNHTVRMDAQQGNAGVLDQRAALKWILRNAEYFGVSDFLFPCLFQHLFVSVLGVSTALQSDSVQRL